MTADVRDASAEDAPDVQRVAAAAWRDTYRGLLAAETIESFIGLAYGAETILRRIEHDTFLVAVIDGSVRAFADAVERERHLALAAIYDEPEWRSLGLGSGLLAELRRRFPGAPIAADVLIGNRLGEAFYDRRGFVPREMLEAELFGEAVRERRWWLGAPPEAPSSG
jgi:GNAT superfamily N-acetyltransferase